MSKKWKLNKKPLLIGGGILAIGFIFLGIALLRSPPGEQDWVMVNGQRVPVSTESSGPGKQDENPAADPTEEDPDEPVWVGPGQSGGETQPGEYVENDPGGFGNYGDISGGDEEPEETAPPGLTCDDFALFSGQYVEDGRDELVENVAAILVTNQSGRFLDFASLTYDIDGNAVTFVVTGLPPGRSAWVMAQGRARATNSSVFTYVDSVTSYRDDVVASTDAITITADGNMLTATNNTAGTLENVCVYYRGVHSDGNFFGGITYLVSFGTLEPGASGESLAGHYDAGSSEIIRVGWQTG